MSSQNQTFNPPNHPSFAPTYNHISRVPISEIADLVSFAGQIGRDSNGHTPKTLSEQVTVAFANVDRCLEAVGASKGDIIQVKQYVVNLLPVDPARAKLYTEVSMSR